MKYFFIFYLICFCVNVNAQKQIIVAKDGSGNYTTVQESIKAADSGTTIFIKKGIYYEQIIIEKNKQYINLLGEDKENTILTFNNHSGAILPSGEKINTNTSASVFIFANFITSQNITFQNDAGFNAGQAVAIRVDGDKIAFFNCKFLGFQDVLYLNGKATKNYFENCYIEGTTDFIFGSATAVFKNCIIKSKKNSHVTAASTQKEQTFGFVFFKCKLIADTGLHKVSLGRPWQPYANVIYMKCNIGNHILPIGWNNWQKIENEKTARFAEYKSKGAGANKKERVPWAKQLTKKEAKLITKKNILQNWKPKKLI